MYIPPTLQLPPTTVQASIMSCNRNNHLSHHIPHQSVTSVKGLPYTYISNSRLTKL